MKKKIFNWLFVLVILPCMLFVNGCGKDDDKDPDNEKMELVSDFSEVNNVLSQLSQNRANLKQFKVSGQKVETGKYNGEVVTSTQELKGSADYENNQFVLKSIYDDEYVVNHVKKVGNDYVSYRHSNYLVNETDREDGYVSYYVGLDYVENELFYYDGVGINISKLDLSNYNKLVESYKYLAKENFILMVDYYHVYFEFNPEITLSKNKNGDYLFEYKVETDIFKNEGLSNVVVESSVKFNKNSVLSTKTFYKFVYESTEEMSCLLEMNYSTGFDSSLLINDFSVFTGQPESKDVSIGKVIDGFYDQWDVYEHEYSKGEALIVEHENDVENTTIKWYLDSYYTKDINTLNDSPSYFMAVYGKTIPNEGYGLIIEYGYLKDSNGNMRFVGASKKAVEAGQIYNVPSSMKMERSCYEDICSYYEGDITIVKVNNNVFGEGMFEIENGKTYIIYQEANQENEKERNVYGIYSYDESEGYSMLVEARYDKYDNFESLKIEKIYDTITSCPSGYDTAIDLTYPGVSYSCENIEGNKTKIVLSMTDESVDAGYRVGNFVYMELVGYYSIFEDKDYGVDMVYELITSARDENLLGDGSYYFIFDGDVIDN